MIMLKKTAQALLISASLLSLAACSTTGSDNAGGANGGYGTGGANGATASGLGTGTSFGGGPNGNANPMQVGNQSYYFDFDQSTVHDSDMPSIKVQADYLATHPSAKVLLEGNTDERGSREYNIGLGERRALSVAAVLEADGVNKNQITTVSYGAEKPIALGQDEASYAKNRRVDLVYSTPVNSSN